MTSDYNTGESSKTIFSGKTLLFKQINDLLSKKKQPNLFFNII